MFYWHTESVACYMRTLFTFQSISIWFLLICWCSNFFWTINRNMNHTEFRSYSPCIIDRTVSWRFLFSNPSKSRIWTAECQSWYLTRALRECRSPTRHLITPILPGVEIFQSQHGESRSPQKFNQLLFIPLHSNPENFIKSANNLLSNVLISNGAVSMVIRITTKF